MTKDNNNFKMKKSALPQRRGVSVIIGGTIVAAILFTSVFTYFMVISQAMDIRGKTDVQAQRVDDQKKLETVVMSALTPVQGNNKFLISVNNTGSMAVDAGYFM